MASREEGAVLSHQRDGVSPPIPTTASSPKLTPGASVRGAAVTAADNDRVASVIFTSLTSERDKSPAARMQARRALETQRDKERRMLDARRREAIARADRAREGHDTFERMWHDTQKAFDASEESRSMIARCTGYLSDKMERKDHPRVLVVSDHCIRLAFYAEMLRMVGCHVETSRSLSQAVSIAAPLFSRSVETGFDLIIADRPRVAASDVEAAQMLMDFSYSVRIRDAVYRKENFCTVSNKFVLVLGQTDLMAPFVIQTGADTLCVRRPFYFHLKRIRQLLLPPFVNTSLRLRLYRRDPNYPIIQRILGTVEDHENKKKKASGPLFDNSDCDSEDDDVDGGSSSRNKQKDPADLSSAPARSSASGGKQFVTFESLVEENDHLHNVVIAHIRNKARLEDIAKEAEASWKEKEERFHYTIQGLEGQLRERDHDMAELTELAKQLRSKLHEMQLKELQLTQQLAAQQRKPKKKDAVAMPPATDLAAPSTSLGNIPTEVSVAQTSVSHYGSGVFTTPIVLSQSAALGNQLESFMSKQADDAKKRSTMLEAIREAGKLKPDNEVVRAAKLHAVEVNSKPIQCDIWYQSPQEQAELSKLMALQYRAAMGLGKKSGPGGGGSSKAKTKTQQLGSAAGSDLATPSDPAGRSPTLSRAQSRQHSRQNSRGGQSSRAGSVTSAEGEFFGAGAAFAELGAFPSIGGGEEDVSVLRVENMALKKQIQFFKMQRSLTTQGLPQGLQSPDVRSAQVNPTADVLVSDGMLDVSFLHKKIATLSQQVSILEGSLSRAHRSPRPAGDEMSINDGDDAVRPQSHGDEVSRFETAIAREGPTALPPPAARRHSSSVPLLNPAEFLEQENMSLRMLVSRLEYKVHTLDLHRITSVMQKLVYKGAMMRLLNGRPSDALSDGTAPPTKKRTKDAAVNTVIDSAQAASWVEQSSGTSLFSAKEMEQKLLDLTVKLKESTQMFKESREQHMQAERHTLEMRLELEKMQSTSLEITDQLKGTKRLLTTAEETVKMLREKYADAETRIATLEGDNETKEKLITELRWRPITTAVGCQTKVTGDVTKKSTFAAGSKGDAASLGGGMRSVMRAHGHDIPVTPRGDEDDGGTTIYVPQQTAASEFRPPRSPAPQSIAYSGAETGSWGSPRDQLSSATTDASGAFDATLSSANAALQSALVDAPSDDEINFLVTTRMAALAMYSAALVDGADVPRSEHESIVNRLKKECSDYVTTIRKLNDVRNAQRVEISELRIFQKEMRDNKTTIPQLRQALEEVTTTLAEERKNTKAREKLQKKEFDLLRLKYAHDDDLVAMAAFDIDSFAVHTLRAPFDIPNDHSIKFVCRGVEYALGAARRLLADVTEIKKLDFVNESTQTNVFVDHLLNANGEELPSNDVPLDRRARRKASVSIVESAPGAAAASPKVEERPAVPSLTKQLSGNALNKLRRTNSGGGLTAQQHHGPEMVQDSILKNSVAVLSSFSPPVVAAASLVKEAKDIEIQTVELSAWASDSGVQCMLLTEASVLATVAPQRKSVVHRHQAKPAAPPPPRPPEDASSLASPSKGPASDADALSSSSPTVVPTSNLPGDTMPQVHRAVATPVTRSSLLHTPASRHSSRQHRRSYATGGTSSPFADGGENDVLTGSQPGSASFLADYESVSLVEQRHEGTQTDASLQHPVDVSVILDWVSQLERLESFGSDADDATRRASAWTAEGSSPTDVMESSLRQQGLVTALKRALSTLLPVAQNSLPLIDVMCIDAPQGTQHNTEVHPTGHESSSRLSLNLLAAASHSRHSSAARQSMSLSPRAASMSSVTDVSPLLVRGQEQRGDMSGRFPTKPHTTTILIQTDPVVILDDPLHPPFRRSDAFSIFHGDFEQANAVGDAIIPKHAEHVADACVQADDDSGDSEESDTEPSHVALEAAEGVGEAMAQQDALPIERRWKNRRARRDAQTHHVARDDTGTQTEADIGPHKLTASFVALHQAFQKLVAKLRMPLCLPQAVPERDSSWTTFPTVKAMSDASQRDCGMIDLMLEKLSIAYRGLRNAGLHGADFAVSALSFLVDGGQAPSHQFVGAGGTPPRHLEVKESPAKPFSKRLPPLTNGAVAVDRFLMDGDGSDVHHHTTLAIASHASAIVQLAPVRGVDEVLLMHSPVSHGAPTADAHLPPRATGSPVPGVQIESSSIGLPPRRTATKPKVAAYR